MQKGVVNKKSTVYILFMPGPKPTYTERLEIRADKPLMAALNAESAETTTKQAKIVRAALRAYGPLKRRLEQMEAAE